MLGFSKPSADIESRVNRLYRAFATTAKRYRYTFRRPEITPGGKPTVVFLGNHSSGKSTIVNDLLGDPPVQDTGVAPTDDAFTVLVHGEDEHEFYGPAALGQLPSEFQSLRALGPDFLQHFAVKVRNRDFLKGVNLVDSPGMIDTPEGSASRAYDFPAAVRSFTELSDLVLFLFDPDKPGTTGETVDVLSSCLHGIEFKLRVLLNKADTFDSMEDYARAYGTLCWNLARVLRTKDLPPVFSTYTPSTGARLAARVPLESFERHRGQLLELLRNVGQRRIDSVLAGATADFSRLSIQARVLGAVRTKLFAGGAVRAAAVVLATAAAFGLAWFFGVHRAAPDASRLRVWLGWGGAGLAAAVAFCASALAAAWARRRRRARLIANLDATFRDLYAETLAVGAHGDLEQNWADVKPEVAAVLKSGGPVPLFSWGDFSRIDRAVREELPSIARADRGPAEA